MGVREVCLYAVKIDAGETPSGNTKRGYLIYRECTGDLVGFAEQEYNESQESVFMSVAVAMNNRLTEAERRRLYHRVVLLCILRVPHREYAAALRHDIQWVQGVLIDRSK